MNTPTVQTISECFIKPQYSVEKVKPPIHLAAWDLAMLSVHYIQKGLLFIKPQTKTNDQENPVESLLNRLKDSLSLTLVHFYPLAGRLATLKQENPPSYSVYIDCNNSPGAKFIYASADLTIDDILSPVDASVVVQSFFDHDRAINHDGHSMSLLSIQVTELNDGIVVQPTMRLLMEHLIGISSKFCRRPSVQRKRVLEFLDLQFLNAGSLTGTVLCTASLSLTTISFLADLKRPRPPLRERIFHFSSESIAKLKAKANSESKSSKISSFQSVSALVLRCVIRTQCRPQHLDCPSLTFFLVAPKYIFC